jgi:hypothetical protein
VDIPQTYWIERGTFNCLTDQQINPKKGHNLEKKLKESVQSTP